MGKRVIGIDIGGTKILGGIVEEDGTLLKVKQVGTQAEKGKDAILANLFRLIDDLIAEGRVDGIGVGSAGRIDHKRGVVVYATDNLPGWTGLPLKGIIEDKYQVAVAVDNDVNAAVLGEMWLGAGRNYRDILMMTIGTGVGGAVVADGKLIRGSSCSAGEIGHMILYPEGKQCNCGRKGCLEQYISGTALYKQYNELSKNLKVNNAWQVFELYKQRDEIAAKVIGDFVRLLSISIMSIKNILDPEVFIIGGGVVESKDLWWDDLKTSLGSDINIMSAELGDKATMFGAVQLVL
ncbi:ROK family protein [Caldicoprobacter algeriensis]|nr:ROK family protein [Caldicoprobacter algeriensis]